MKIDSLRRAFGSRPFTRSEAAVILGTPKPDSLLAAMRARGWIERTARGTYRVRPPEDYALVLEHYWDERTRRLLTAPIRIALDGPDAARVWTNGAYHVGDVPGSRVLYLAVHPDDEGALRPMLAADRIPVGSAEDPPAGTGLKAVIRPWKEFRRVIKERLPVIPLEELRRLAAESPLAYEGFEEWVRP